MNTEEIKSALNTDGAAMLYWICLMIGVLMWTIGELTTTSHLREISRNVEELKLLVEQVQEQTQCVEMAHGTAPRHNVSSQPPAIGARQPRHSGASGQSAGVRYSRPVARMVSQKNLTQNNRGE